MDRSDLLTAAEKVVEESAGTKVLLEISYLGEVGSGLGPTLEFFALVSRELQRIDLEIWRGSESVIGPGIDGTKVTLSGSVCKKKCPQLFLPNCDFVNNKAIWLKNEKNVLT